MSKYSSTVDAYTDPETGVLKNRLGIKDEKALDRAEAAVFMARSLELAREPIKGNFDLNHLKAIHSKQFGDVYEWAGQLRTVDISKGETRFAHYGQIEREADKLTSQLAREKHLSGLAPEDFSKRAAHYMGEMNVLHPFRDGNGRALREFVGQLAHQNGYEIKWQNIERADMTKASIEAYHGSSDRLAALIRPNLIDRDREQAAELARAGAGRSVQIEHAKPGESYSGRIIGATARYVVQERGDKPGEAVLHNRRSLAADAEKLTGKNLQIAYPHGAAGIVREQGREADRTTQHHHNREKE